MLLNNNNKCDTHSQSAYLLMDHSSYIQCIKKKYIDNFNNNNLYRNNIFKLYNKSDSLKCFKTSKSKF